MAKEECTGTEGGARGLGAPRDPPWLPKGIKALKFKHRHGNATQALEEILGERRINTGEGVLYTRCCTKSVWPRENGYQIGRTAAMSEPKKPFLS
ncbi:hypothetical protein cyc_05394 [Cyclospora cayetanensis]|uniref:Uncharacterized protein n=1 Tax=Cyclospora cayetanensis TaxID=88456 RepID=A0A1D3D673_9EIME|nr:hypothetical protein cyc_05394 [Cyclospora cayetanensis]